MQILFLSFQAKANPKLFDYKQYGVLENMSRLVLFCKILILFSQIEWEIP